MKLSAASPKVTDKFKIEVPTHQFYSNYAVYKIWFGKKFFIWKGKSMLQSAQTVATLLERALRLGNNDKEHYLYHIVAYVKRARVVFGYVEIVAIADFDDTDWVKYLQIEQNLLTAHRNDADCLNNNFDVYVPEWMGAKVKFEFEQWKAALKAKKSRKKTAK